MPAKVLQLKSDKWIKEMALKYGMIEPFQEKLVVENVISYGLSSYGYDIRIADEFMVFTNVYETVVDPKNFNSVLLAQNIKGVENDWY